MEDNSIIEKTSAVYKRISAAAMKAGRNPDDIVLIAVTKTVGTMQIVEAIDAGLRIFGESRVQEAQKKVASDELRVLRSGIKWHLIGHLQGNKAKHAVRLFDLIHSIDSIGLAEEINRQAEKIGKVQDALIEVKLSDEESKHGVSKEGLFELLKSANRLENLHIKGLMAIPPYFDNPEDARPYFRELRGLRDTINESRTTHHALRDLSMGMSHDFEVAIEEGATMVRIGTAIFGERG